MTKLDRSRPYATVHPVKNGVAYEQDGKPFDTEGREIRAEKKPAEKPAKEPLHVAS